MKSMLKLKDRRDKGCEYKVIMNERITSFSIQRGGNDHVVAAWKPCTRRCFM
jgi:hypothetical protein